MAYTAKPKVDIIHTTTKSVNHEHEMDSKNFNYSSKQHSILRYLLAAISST